MWNWQVEGGFNFFFIEHAIVWAAGRGGVLVAFDGIYEALDAAEFEDSLCKIIPAAYAFVAVVKYPLKLVGIDLAT